MLSYIYRRVVGLSNPINIYKSIVSARRKKSCCYLTEYNLQENVSEANWLYWFPVIKRHGPTAWDILPYFGRFTPGQSRAFPKYLAGRIDVQGKYSNHVTKSSGLTTLSCWLYGSRLDSFSNRNEYQECFLRGKGGRRVELTTLPSICVHCLEIWDPQPARTLWAYPSLYRDCFCFITCSCWLNLINGYDR
jgi:hypothetical protein